jgi:hypothetical protein
MGTDTASGADLTLSEYFIWESMVIDTELEVCTDDSDCTGSDRACGLVSFGSAFGNYCILKSGSDC